MILTTRRNRTGDALDSAAIVAMTAAALERAIRHDWLRLSVAAAALPGMPTWCTLGLARVQLKPEEFEARWLLGDVLADLPEGGGRVLCVCTCRTRSLGGAGACSRLIEGFLGAGGGRP